MRGAWSSSDQARKRCNLKQRGQSRQREYASVGVSHHGAKRVIDARPTNPAKHSDERHTTEAHGLSPQGSEVQGLVSRGSSVVSALAFEHRLQAVIGLIEYHEAPLQGAGREGGQQKARADARA